MEIQAAGAGEAGMASIDKLAERVERLLLRHEELQRTHALTLQQLLTVEAERDSLKSRLSAARQRIDALLDRLPHNDPTAVATPETDTAHNVENTGA